MIYRSDTNVCYYVDLPQFGMSVTLRAESPRTTSTDVISASTVPMAPVASSGRLHCHKRTAAQTPPAASGAPERLTLICLSSIAHRLSRLMRDPVDFTWRDAHRHRAVPTRAHPAGHHCAAERSQGPLTMISRSLAFAEQPRRTRAIATRWPQPGAAQRVSATPRRWSVDRDDVSTGGSRRRRRRWRRRSHRRLRHRSCGWRRRRGRRRRRRAGRRPCWGEATLTLAASCGAGDVGCSCRSRSPHRAIGRAPRHRGRSRLPTAAMIAPRAGVRASAVAGMSWWGRGVGAGGT